MGEKSNSEFGKGLTYCLGLFLAHEAMYAPRNDGEKKIMRASSWFNGASDHLYELQIPTTLPKSLQTRLGKFRGRMLDLGHGFNVPNNKITWDEVQLACDEAKTLLRLIDKHYGIATLKGAYQ